MSLSWTLNPHAKTVSIAIYDYPPVFILDSEERPGYIPEIIEQAFNSQGYEVQFIELNLPRAMQEVAFGNIDLIGAINPYNSQDLTLHDIPIVNIDFYLWVNNKSVFRYSGPESLNGLRILNIQGYNYAPAGPDFQEYLDQHPQQIIHLSGDTPLLNAFKMLIHERADTIALDADNTRYYLQKLNKHNALKTAGKLPKRLQGYLAIGKGNPKKEQLFQAFSAGLINLKDSGELQAIHQKYGIQ